MAVQKWLIGCSGFHYREWKEAFYPKGLPASRWLDFYTQHFNTLEINNTFYRFPQLKTFETWYTRSPENFNFSVKVPQSITHFKQFRDTRDLLQEFYDLAAAGLKEKLGCILFQLPPKFSYNTERLSEIISQTNFMFKNVIEFRNISWWRKDVFEVLQQNNICFCGVSYPGLINDVQLTAPFSYYRFHGVPKLYYSNYEEAFLRSVYQATENGNVAEAYLYFNNTASLAAIDNARFLQTLIKAEAS